MQLTALLDALHGRAADGLVHRLNGLLDRGARILVRVRACGKAGGVLGSGQWGAGRSERNGSEERHVLLQGFGNGEAVVVGASGLLWVDWSFWEARWNTGQTGQTTSFWE